MSYKNMNLSDKKTKTFVNCLCNYFGSGEPTFDILSYFLTSLQSYLSLLEKARDTILMSLLNPN